MMEINYCSPTNNYSGQGNNYYNNNSPVEEKHLIIPLLIIPREHFRRTDIISSTRIMSRADANKLKNPENCQIILIYY